MLVWLFSEQIVNMCLIFRRSPEDTIEGSNMNFHSLTFAWSRGKCLKPEGEARGFQPSRGTLRILMTDKIMFDRYYCIKSANHLIAKMKKTLAHYI